MWEVGYNQRGEVYYKKGEYDKAIADLNEVIRLDPEWAAGYNNRGVVYRERGEYDKAIADLTEAIRRDPKVALFYSQRGIAYGYTREYDKAIADCTEAIRVNPEEFLGYSSRGFAYRLNGEYDKAIADYSDAIRLNPIAKNYSGRSKARLEKGDYDGAIADSVEAVQHEPDKAVFWFWRVLAPLAAGRSDDCRNALAEMIQRFGKSDDPATARIVSRACARTPNLGAAWPSLRILAERAARREPYSSEVVALLGAVLYRAGAYELAIQRLTEADRLVRDPSEIAVDDSPARIWFFMSMAHDRLGHTAEARKWLDKAGQWAEMDTREVQAGMLPRMYFDFARRLALKFLQQEAETLLGAKAASLADPPALKTAESYRNLGRELAKKGDFGGAIDAYRAAIRLNPKVPDSFHERGMAFAGKGNMGEAITDFRELIRLQTTCSRSWLAWLSCWLPAVIRTTERPPGIVFVSDLPWVKSTSGGGKPEAVRDHGKSSDQILIAGLPYSKGIQTHAFDDAQSADVVLDI
jgi:tetratricopeptide (TPR) repeat protein